MYTQVAQWELQPSGIYTLSNLPRTRFGRPGANHQLWSERVHSALHNRAIAYVCTIAQVHMFAYICLLAYFIFSQLCISACTGEQFAIIEYLPSTVQKNCIYKWMAGIWSNGREYNTLFILWYRLKNICYMLNLTESMFLGWNFLVGFQRIWGYIVCSRLEAKTSWVWFWRRLRSRLCKPSVSFCL